MKLLNTLAGGIVLVGSPLQASKVPQIQVPLSREGQLCQTIVENAEKALAYIQDPQPGPELELSNPLKPFMHDYTMIEQINVVFKGVIEESLKVNHGQTLLEAREELEEAKTTIGEKDSEIERLEGLLPPSYNTPLTIVNIVNGNLEQKFTPEDTDLRLMISAFPNNWADCNITPANIKSISVLNALKAWPQEVLNDCTNLEEFLTYGPESESIEEGLSLTSDFFGTVPQTLQLPSLVTSIGSYAFKSCSDLTSVTFPASLTSIERSAFYYCTGLNSVNFSRCINLLSIGIQAFYYCLSLTSVDLSRCTALTSIEDHAFYYCPGLTSVTLPASLTSIGESTFARCTALTSVTFPTSLTSIGAYAFSSCIGLTTVTFPNSLISIGSYAFESCSGLNSVTFPTSLTSIGNNAFSSCSNLKTVIWGKDPADVRCIEWYYENDRGTAKENFSDIGFNLSSQKHYLRNVNGSLTELS